MGYGRGLDFLKGQQESMGSRGQRMNKLWLKQGESAKVWFIQDHTEISVPLVHMVAKQRRNGTPYNADVLCGRYSIQEDHSVCTLCLKVAEQYALGDAVPLNERVRGPWPRFVATVFVEFILHTARKEGTNWPAVQRNEDVGKTLYKEDVNDYQLLIMRDKVTDQIKAFLAGDPMSDQPAPTTLLDRFWRFSVTGEGANKQEFLQPADASPKIPDIVMEARAKAPALDKVIIDEFGESPRRAATLASGSGHTDPSSGAAIWSTGPAEKTEDDPTNYNS